MESTTSSNSCFLKGRGATFGVDSHVSMENAMDNVILKHHRAAQQQKERNLFTKTATYGSLHERKASRYEKDQGLDFS